MGWPPPPPLSLPLPPCQASSAPPPLLGALMGHGKLKEALDERLTKLSFVLALGFVRVIASPQWAFEVGSDPPSQIAEQLHALM